MLFRPALRAARVAAVLALLGTLGFAGQTRTWSQGEYSEYEKGIIKNLSVRSDGVLTLAPEFREVFDSSSAYLWAVARDSKGDLYAGGGPGAKLFRITPKGDKKTLAELDGLSIQAIAVDGRDRVYAATSPDSKVYRIAAGGKPELFYSPKSKYVWALAFDSGGDLLVATGDPGEIHRVTPAGQGSVIFKTDETHARSMAIDAHGNIIVGTDPGGLVIRVSPAGQGFVLYQMDKKEVTSVAVAKDGSIYAAGVGTKTAGMPPPSLPPAVVTPVPMAPSGTGGAQVIMHAATPPATLGSSAASITGGSEVYRIDPDGNPEKVWSNGQDVVYTLAFDPQGHALLGTGNKGYIYRVDSNTLYTALLNTAPTQITSFCSGPDGQLYAATGNVGKVYEIGPALARQGSIESSVFDAGLFSQWGRLSFEGHANGGNIALAARSGNLDQPQKNWSPWSPEVSDAKGARAGVPSARFAQWRATLSTSGAQSPELDNVEFAYLPRNVAPRVEQIEITPDNYKFPPASPALVSTQTLNLPAMTRSHAASSGLTLTATDTTSTPAMQYAKGFIGARWLAADDNGDDMIYTVQIRGIHETGWKPLKDKLKNKYVSWDSSALPDGEYVLRVVASDSPSNAPGQALTSSLVSDPFIIDNTPPQISGLAAGRSGSRIDVRWTASDTLTNVSKAEYSLDGGDWTVAPPVGGLSDSLQLSYTLALDNAAPGEHTIAVRVTDEYDNQSTAKSVVP